MKKIYTCFLCMIMSAFLAVMVQASPEHPELEVGKIVANAGESVEVPLSLADNTNGILGASITVSYDEKLSLVSITNGTALNSLTMTKPGNLSANPFNILWAGVEVDKTNGDIAILTFNAPEEPGNYSIAITYSPENIVDNDFNPVELIIINGCITVSDNKTDAEKAEELANAIREMDPTDRQEVERLRLLYNSLSEEGKALIDSDTLDLLVSAEEAFKIEDEKKQEDVQAAAQVEALIDNLDPTDEESVKAARDAYDNLTAEQKELVSSEVLNKLIDAENQIEENKKNHENQIAVSAVVDLINNIDLSDEESVNNARNAYDILTEDQKLLVDPEIIDKLLSAEKEIEEKHKIVDQNAADEVISKINSLPENITADDAELIKSIRNAYDSLTESQKALISGEILTKLESAENILIVTGGHDLTEVKAVEADCITEGNIKYWHCVDCGKNFLNNDGTEELSESDIVIPAYGHKWNDGIITKEASEFEDGVKLYSCVNCDATREEALKYIGSTEIHEHAFAENTSISELVIGESIISVGDEAFAGCINLKKLYFKGDMPVFGSNVFKNVPHDVILYYPLGNATWSKEAVEAAGITLTLESWHAGSELEAVTLDKCTISVEEKEYTYDGTEHKPAVVVKYNEIELKEGTDYTLEYSENINAGLGKITIIGSDEYSGTTTRTFAIAKANGELVFNTKVINKRVKDQGFTIQPDTLVSDGEVLYSSSDNAVALIDSKGYIYITGGGSVTITATVQGNNYTTATDSIQLNIEKLNNMIEAYNRTVNGNGKNQTISIGASSLSESEMTYTSNQRTVKIDKSGKITIPAAFSGEILVTIKAAPTNCFKEATKTISVIVTPKATTLSKVTSSAKKTMSISWVGEKSATGYEIQYATNKKFTKNLKSALVSKNKTVKKTIKKLVSNKKYFVRIRTYKVINGDKYYSKWSKIKSVKVK